MTISDHIQIATNILRDHGIADPRFEALSLLAFAIQKDKVFLIAHPEYEISESEENSFRDSIKRRSNREPFQHITGKQEFYGLDFEVDRNVLIPRPETELIVENAIEILSDIENPRFCEVGIGSGCISISILHNVENATAIGLEISEKALEVCLRNSQKHSVVNRLELRHSDVFESLDAEKFDVIVSNPPYISENAIADLQAEVRDFEPINALTDGSDGFSIIRKIGSQTPDFLKSGGFLLMEIGFGQADSVKEMFSDQNWQSVMVLNDLQGIPRMVNAKLR